MLKKNIDLDREVKKSLSYSITEGSFWSIMAGFGESFFGAFAVFLKATNVQIGLLGSLPQFLGALSQLFTLKLLGFFKSRKKFVVANVALQALMHLPIMFAFFIPYIRIQYLIFFVCLYFIFGAIGSPAWNSWMGNLVDSSTKGSFFGVRNRLINICTLLSFVAGGYILYHFSDGSMRQFTGYAVIFFIALLARLISSYLLSKQYEPHYAVSRERDVGFIEIFKKTQFKNFKNFALYIALLNFGVFIAGPFFTPYMLYELKFNYLQFTIINATAIAVKFLFTPIWGRHIDVYGSKKALILAGVMMPLSPVLWFFSQNFWYLVIIQIYSGFVWSGMDTASATYIFDSTLPYTRIKSLSYYNLLSGTAMLIGALIGGYTIRLNNIFWSKYLLVFIISGIIRLFALALLLKIKETRPVEKTSYDGLFFKIVSSEPIMNTLYSFFFFRRKKARDEKKFSIHSKKGRIMVNIK